MLNPKLDDWWTKNKLIKINLRGQSLDISGLSLNYFLESVDYRNLIFLSAVDGQYEDNLFLLVLNSDQAKNLSLQPHSQHSPASEQSGLNLNEFLLPVSLKPAHLASAELEEYFWDINTPCEYKFYIHDNCFSSMYPATEANLLHFIAQVLEVHSFYLGREVEWGNLVEKILQLLQAHLSVDIQTKDSDKVIITYYIPNPNKFNRVLFPLAKQTIEIVIQNNRAKFE